MTADAASSSSLRLWRTVVATVMALLHVLAGAALAYLALQVLTDVDFGAMPGLGLALTAAAALTSGLLLPRWWFMSAFIGVGYAATIVAHAMLYLAALSGGHPEPDVADWLGMLTQFEPVVFLGAAALALVDLILGRFGALVRTNARHSR